MTPDSSVSKESSAKINTIFYFVNVCNFSWGYSWKQSRCKNIPNDWIGGGDQSESQTEWDVKSEETGAVTTSCVTRPICGFPIPYHNNTLLQHNMQLHLITLYRLNAGPNIPVPLLQKYCALLASPLQRKTVKVTYSKYWKETPLL